MNQLVPYMVNENEWNWGLKTGWFYTGVGLPFMVGCWLLIPETTGYDILSVLLPPSTSLESKPILTIRSRSVAELNELFEGKVRPYRFHKSVTGTQLLAKQEGNRCSSIMV